MILISNININKLVDLLALPLILNIVVRVIQVLTGIKWCQQVSKGELHLLRQRGANKTGAKTGDKKDAKTGDKTSGKRCQKKGGLHLSRQRGAKTGAKIKRCQKRRASPVEANRASVARPLQFLSSWLPENFNQIVTLQNCWLDHL